MPRVNFLILVVIQLFCSVSSCSYRKDRLFANANLRQSEDLVPSESACNPWKSSHSNKSKAVLVLFSLKTYKDIFFECFVASASSNSRPYQTWFSRAISCQLTTSSNDRVVAQSQPFPFSWQHQSDISNGSNQCCGTERIWHVRLSQLFVSVSKSRWTSMNWL